MKMRRVHLLCLIITGITASNLYNVSSCKTLRSRREQKAVTAITTFNEKNKINEEFLPYHNTRVSDCTIHKAEYVKTLPDFTNGIILETSKKIKRDTPIIPLHSSENDVKETPRTLIATIGDDTLGTLLNNQKTKRNLSGNNPLKSRHTRDKKFMCLCEETKCHNKNCLQAQSSREKTEEVENNAAEVLIDDMNVIDKSSNGPKKFNIPFVNNVNFDQRVILDGKNVQSKSPPIYPIYANPLVYHYTPYTLNRPELIYTGIAPLQQNYAPAVAYNKFPNPSPIPAHLLKLWKNGAQNMFPVADDPKPKSTPAYIPKYSSGENAKREPTIDSSKVTTPRQVNSKLYPHNYLSRGGSNIEDLRPAYRYSTDFLYYNQPYTTEIVSADEFNFITETSNEMKHLPFGDPTTTNYAPSYYKPQRNSGNNNNNNAINNEHSSNFQTALPNQYPNENIPIQVNSFENFNDAHSINNQNIPRYDYNDMLVSTLSPAGHINIPTVVKNRYPAQEDTYDPDNDDGLNIEVDKMINEHRNNDPTMSVPTDSDLKAYNSLHNRPQKKLVPSQAFNQQSNFVTQAPPSYNIKNMKPSKQQQSNAASQPVTTLDDVNNGYTSDYNPQRLTTMRNTNGYKPNWNVAATNTESTDRENENLFKELKNIILHNGDVSDVPPIQAIDERPLTTYENTFRNVDNTIVQNAVKKVLNNLVPGKADDLLANYDSEKSRELARKNGERLLPDLAKTQILKNLLNVPEVENMIVDTTNNLINQVIGSPVSENIIKDTLRNVMREIPRPTTPPKNNLKLKNKTMKRVSRNDELVNREVFEKIKSIIDKSELDDEVATQPLAQNVIVKTVKYSLDKEKGVADEATIRRAFNQLVKSTDNSLQSANSKPLIVQPKENYNRVTTQDTGYKFVPVVPVNERRLQGGTWIEGLKNLIENKTQSNYLENKKRIELEKQLDLLRKNNSTVIANDERTDTPYRSTMSQNVDHKSDVSTREALSKYYDIIGTTVNSKLRPLDNGYNVYQTSPIVTTLHYQNYRDPSYVTQQLNNNRLKLPVTSSTQRSNNNRLNLLVDSTPSDKDLVGVTNEPTYMVWLGDGVKLPLTMRKMSDGSYALTLADEVCQMFAHKKCPCCLPADGQGVITRDRRNDEQDYSDDVEKLLSKKASGKHEEFNDKDYEDSEESNSISNGGPYKYQRYANLDKLISGSTRAIGHMLRLVKDVVTEAHEKSLRRRRNSSKQQVLLF
ncbi:protein PF3D7_1417600-like [Phymastichus coffea]|uniref:protein PF3D7_1417600-like n=1 Tax=Phymastichus coffea TaxID=108790 RepID=UPI00273C5C23|nr:protein PF3D7_1417600-like [Phymastichus coffea]